MSPFFCWDSSAILEEQINVLIIESFVTELSSENHAQYCKHVQMCYVTFIMPVDFLSTCEVSVG